MKLRREEDAVKDRYQPWLEYCYLWACECPGGLFIKIGMTNDPHRRFSEFKTSSPFKYVQAFVCQAPDRELSYALEQEILRTFRAFSTRGEWISIERKKLEHFVFACSEIAKRVVGPEVYFREFKPRSRSYVWRALQS